jgi:hypothetical protein
MLIVHGKVWSVALLRLIRCYGKQKMAGLDACVSAHQPQPLV